MILNPTVPDSLVSVWISDAQGNREIQLGSQSFTSLSASRTVNAVSTLTIEAPEEIFPKNYFVNTVWRDRQLEIWRSPLTAAPKLDLKTVWLLRAVKQSLRAGDSRRMLTLTAQSSNVILARRIVAYASNSTYSNKSGPADDLVKAYVRENMSSLALDPLRQLPSSIFGVQANQSLHPTISLQKSQARLSDVCRDAVQASAITSPNRRLYFDIVKPSATSPYLEFQTFADQRGQARQFLLPANAVADSSLLEDYTTEYNVVYGKGTGVGSKTLSSVQRDDVRIAMSPFARSETIYNAQSLTLQSSLDSRTKAALRDARGKLLFEASLEQILAMGYGDDWEWGDSILVEVLGRVFSISIDTVSLNIVDQKEAIRADIRAEVVV